MRSCTRAASEWLCVGCLLLCCSQAIGDSSDDEFPTTSGCRDYDIDCDRVSNVANCELATGYKPFMQTTFRRVVFGHQNVSRPPKLNLTAEYASLKHSCFIEAAVDKDGRLLHLSFRNNTSLFSDAYGKNADWKLLQQAMRQRQQEAEGMQLLMEVDGGLSCRELWPESRRLRPVAKISARLLPRVAGYDMDEAELKFRTFNRQQLLEFKIPLSELLQLAGRTSNRGSGRRLDEILSSRHRHPVAVWIFKCPASLGFDNTPCNSEVNLHLHLRRHMMQRLLKANHTTAYRYDTYGLEDKITDQAGLLVVIFTFTYIFILCFTLMWLGFTSKFAVV